MATALLDKPSVTDLIEYADNRGGSLRVNRESNVIHGVKVLGFSSRNGRTYLAEAVRKAATLYEGAKVNVDHARDSKAPRSYGDRLGVIRGVTFREGSGLHGDLHYNPKHPLAEQLLHDAEHSPENVGLSHVAKGRSASRNGQTIVEEILSVASVDLVADPATNSTLFESIGDDAMSIDLSKLSVAELLESRPDLKTAILKEHAESEAEKAKDAEIKTLKEALDKLETEKKVAERKTAVDKLITEAKLPDFAVTDTFREQCYGAADDAAVKVLIEDRQALTKGVRAAGTKVISKGQQELQESAQPFDAKAYAARMKA